MSKAASAVYNGLVNTADKFVPSKFRPLWMHPAGKSYFYFIIKIFIYSLI